MVFGRLWVLGCLGVSVDQRRRHVSPVCGPQRCGGLQRRDERKPAQGLGPVHSGWAPLPRELPQSTPCSMHMLVLNLPSEAGNVQLRCWENRMELGG